jgi:diguanylate cyclase (GGDEF)-like protein
VERRVTQQDDASLARQLGLLSVDQVARAIQRHPEVVRRHARSGRLPGERVGRGWFFRPERLVAAGYPQFAVATSETTASMGPSFLAALSEAGMDALQLGSEREIFEAVARRLATVGLGSWYFLVVPDGSGLRIAYAHPLHPTGEEDAQSVGRILSFENIPNLQRTCETRRAQYLGDSAEIVKRVEANLPPGQHAEAATVARQMELRTAISAPMVARDRLLGAITVSGPNLRPADLPAVTAFANQTAAVVEATRLLTEARASEEAMVQTLGMAVDLRDQSGHHASVHVRLLERFAKHLGMDGAARRRLHYTLLLQDLGKLGIPDAILRKRGRLAPEERAVMISHPIRSAEILERFPPLAHLAPLVRAHHEWANGEGYPDGLKGEAIPVETRVVAVVNAFFSITFDMPGFAITELPAALEELERFAGIGLDSALVPPFVQMIREAAASQPAWYAQLLAEMQKGHQAPQPTTGGPRDVLTVADSRELRIIHRVGQEIGAVLELDVLLARIVDIVRDVAGYYRVSLILPTDDGRLGVGAASGQASPGRDLSEPASSGVAEWVFAQGQPLIIPDVTVDPRYTGMDSSVRSELAFPLTSRGRVIGVLDAESQSPDAFTQGDLTLMSAVGSQLAASLEAAQMHDLLKREATRDPLTRLANRRVLLERIEQQIAHAERHNEAFSVVFLDVDQLKIVNDTHGHMAGDALLREVASALIEAVRGEDLVARFGGDEFVVLLPATLAGPAAVVGARIQDAIRRHPFLAGSQLITIPGISLGIATYPDHGRTPEQLLAAADTTLYTDKKRRKRPA